MDEARDAGTNARPLDDTVAGTGPGIADDSGVPGEGVPEAPSDDEVAAVARKLGARRSARRGATGREALRLERMT